MLQDFLSRLLYPINDRFVLLASKLHSTFAFCVELLFDDTVPFLRHSLLISQSSLHQLILSARYSHTWLTRFFLLIVSATFSLDIHSLTYISSFETHGPRQRLKMVQKSAVEKSRFYLYHLQLLRLLSKPGW